MTVKRFATELTARGYVCVPVNIELSAEGKKEPRFGMPWRSVTETPGAEHWGGFTGIGISTGPSGVVVVDVDTNGDKDGFAALSAAGINLPHTPMVVTSWSGGKHYYYRARTDTKVGTSAGVLADGVDIRAEGGMIFAPPTTVGDKSYEFDGLAYSVDKLPLFPKELAERLVMTAPQPRRKVRAVVSPEQITDQQREYALTRIEYRLKDIASAGDGERNRVLGKSVPRICGLVKTIGGDPEEYAEKIQYAYLESGGSDLKQVEDWIVNGFDYAEPEDPRRWLPEDRERAFWDSRPELQRIKQAAFSGMASPWAVLGALCVRVLADVPPTHRILTGIGDPEGGNLNLYVVLAAASGGGKGVASQVARYLWPSDTYSVEIASGEALSKQFARKAKDPATSEYVTERIRDSVIIDAPEFGSVSASAARTGATLMQRLCNGFSGEGLTFAVSDESKNVEVEANSYRLGVITGVQYGNAGLLLDSQASVTGVPQRFVWFPANVKAEDLPDIQPEQPAPFSGPPLTPPALRIDVCDEAKRELVAARRAHLIGDTSSPLDGHKLYARVKLAYALALLNGHYESVRSEDWELSGVIIEVSDATRQKAVDSLSKRSRKEAEDAGKRDGVRKAVAAEAEVDERLFRQVGVLRRALDRTPGGMTRNQLKKSMRSNHQAEFFEPALEALQSEGGVRISGDTYYPNRDTRGH